MIRRQDSNFARQKGWLIYREILGRETPILWPPDAKS